MNRKKVVLSTGLIKLVASLVTVVINFVIRKVLIANIGVDYLGLNGVLVDVISMLSITELGFQTAIVYRLYKPIAQNNVNEINEIMSLLKKIYAMIGIIILLVGICITPFLKYIIHTSKIPYMVVILSYLILLLSAASTYFISYKRTMLYADQKQIISTSIDIIFGILFGIFKIVSIIIFKNYLFFVSLVFAQNVVSNIFINCYCKKLYPKLRFVKNVNYEIKKSLIIDTKNVFVGKIASYVYSSTDNLVISTFINTATVGIVGNYIAVMNAITGLIISAMSPLQPMIGNYLLTENKNKNVNLFNGYSFIRFVMTMIMLLPAGVLVDKFITIFYGDKYLCGNTIISLLLADLYISIIYGPIGEYISASGLFKKDKYVLMAGTVVNIAISVVGAICIGVEGVLLGTAISQLTMWIGRSLIAFKYCFSFKIKEYIDYWLNQICYIIVFVFSFFIEKTLLNYFFGKNDLLNFIVGGFSCVIISSIIIILLYYKSSSFKFIFNIIKRKK